MNTRSQWCQGEVGTHHKSEWREDADTSSLTCTKCLYVFAWCAGQPWNPNGCICRLHGKEFKSKRASALKIVRLATVS